MRLHRNAALSWSGRRVLARRVLVQGWTLRAAAQAAGVSVRCARRWVGRYRVEGEQGLADRSSAPRRVANRTPDERVALIVGLRRLRMTAAEIAETLSMPLSTVSVVLKRQGLGRLGRIGLEPPLRYERQRPGELVHVDVKKLGRIRGGVGHRVSGSRASQRKITRDGRRVGHAGWEYVHVAVDDYSRLAYVDVLDDERAASAAAFPAPRHRLLCALRHPRRADTDRQRLRLPRHHPRAHLQSARHPPPPQPSLPTSNQRQSRALHPHTAQRLGLRSHLRLKPRTHQST
jgi:transposase